MISKLLFALWVCLFSLCAGLGFIPEPDGLMANVFTGLAVASFLPPFLLLYRAVKTGNRFHCMLIRNLSAISLGLTLAALIGNFFTAFASETLGQILHDILIIVSSPMICSGHWALSLFLWACLLVVSSQQIRKIQ